MTTIQFSYEGHLSCRVVHAQSGAVIMTDAPKESHGKGLCFSPTDLVAVALGSCMLTTMGSVAHTLSLDITGTTATVEKEMTNSPTRRVHRLAVRISVPKSLTQEQKEKFDRSVRTCPVQQCLSSSIETSVDFEWC
jgi:putative redox protein